MYSSNSSKKLRKSALFRAYRVLLLDLLVFACFSPISTHAKINGQRNGTYCSPNGLSYIDNVATSFVGVRRPPPRTSCQTSHYTCTLTCSTVLELHYRLDRSTGWADTVYTPRSKAHVETHEHPRQTPPQRNLSRALCSCVCSA